MGCDRQKQVATTQPIIKRSGLFANNDAMTMTMMATDPMAGGRLLEGCHGPIGTGTSSFVGTARFAVAPLLTSQRLIFASVWPKAGVFEEVCFRQMWMLFILTMDELMPLFMAPYVSIISSHVSEHFVSFHC
jgi:hypothetical protein